MCEAKDAAERDAKAARRAAGKSALKGLLSERAKLVDGRKAQNRVEEAAKERDLVDAMSGAPWTRVYDLVDVHAPAAGAAAAAAGADAGAGGGKKKAAGEAVGDLQRMKDVLIAAKNDPPAGSA